MPQYTSSSLTLLPKPRMLEILSGSYRVSQGGKIVVNSRDAQAILPAALKLQTTLKEKLNSDWGLRAGSPPPGGTLSIMLNQLSGGINHPQGYVLHIAQDRIDLTANSPQGIFYGIQTLMQIIENCGSELPQLICRDWPDFPHRGVMLDISRDRVPTMETLFELIDLLASWKINQVQLYTEHTFAYQNHPTVWAEASPITGEQAMLLDAYCRERFIELVPNQNSFGHMNRWLQHAEYIHLAECPDGFETMWGFQSGPFSLTPTEPGSLKLIQGLYDELLPHFSSQQVNVGCDETFDLGLGKSKALVEQLGEGQVYLDFLLKLYRDLQSRGKIMQFWGDILNNHPRLIPELPRDVIALEWGYEAGHPFDAHCAAFAQSGIPFYVCPGTSSWNSLAGRTDNALENIRSAAESGLNHGAVGLLNTDWGDNGHWQPLPVSYIGFAYGAGVSWAFAANRDEDMIRVLDRFVFNDERQILGQIAFDLGNIYRLSELQPPNASILFRVLQSAPDELALHASDAAERRRELRTIEARLDEIMASLPNAASGRPDAYLIMDEFAWAADMLRHACRRFDWALDLSLGKENREVARQLTAEADQLMGTYHEIWHARNRPGGYQDSLALFETMHSHYQTY